MNNLLNDLLELRLQIQKLKQISWNIRKLEDQDPNYANLNDPKEYPRMLDTYKSYLKEVQEIAKNTKKFIE